MMDDSAEASGRVRWAAALRRVARSKELVMEPPGPAEPHDLHGLRIDVLRRAVAIYLALAYPAASRPRRSAAGSTGPPALDAEALLAGPPSSGSGKSKRPATGDLRPAAGQHPLPAHEAPDPALAERRPASCSRSTPTTRSSRSTRAPPTPGLPALQAENQRLKEAIEQAWDEAGLRPSSATSATTSRSAAAEGPARRRRAGGLSPVADGPDPPVGVGPSQGLGRAGRRRGCGAG